MESYHLKTKKKEVILEWKEDYTDIYTQQGYIEFIKKTELDGKIIYYHKWYDLKEKKYLFDESKSEEEMYLKQWLDNGTYWIEKNDKIYLYNLKEESWTEVEDD